ncbi:MAG TPA: hypothetical protein ENN06_00960 [Desulfobacteraceae bacterium]|nr:hypothetical protein [Desulfobacteraceae bacterium]
MVQNVIIRVMPVLFPQHAWARLLVLCLVLIAPGGLSAATVELPLSLRTRILQNALQESLTPGPDRKAVLYEKDGSNYFHIADPLLSIRDGEPSFRCDIAAGAGFPSLKVVPSAVHWNGSIEMNLFFYVDDQWQLRYRIIDSAIYDENGDQPMLSSFVWKLARRFLYPLLEDFSFDLSPPQREIMELLRNSVSPEDMEELEVTLNTIRVGTLRADADGIVVPLLLTVADQPPPRAVLPPQEPLSLAEIQRVQNLLEPLDAFLVFVVKSAGADFSNPQLRDQLFDLLITSRYRLLAILAGENPVGDDDPLRSLFVEAWGQLREIIESSEDQDALVQEQLIRYMTFVNAGDALLALDAAAPQLGMHITTDGLRRLARMLQPEYKEDPLRFDWEVDPALRNLFNFLPAAQPDSPLRTLGSRLLDLLIPAAHAAAIPAVAPAEAGRRLDRWVPFPSELDEYQALVALLLEQAALDRVGSEEMESRYAEIYRHLVPATALIESCWRQFTRSNGQVVCVRSQSGSLGIMQINQHVWRGFYDIERLKRDVIYNIEAGTEILMRYFKDNGIKVAGASGRPEYAARAAYCAYNAGPRAARRFFNPQATSREKMVDDRLWEYYRGIAGGGTVDLRTCSVNAAAPETFSPPPDPPAGRPDKPLFRRSADQP